MAVPFKDITEQNDKMFAGENSEKDVERHVTEWIEANEDTWEGWMKMARKAAK
jgi:glycine betaine/proline transport system substrate-binding protein